MRIKLYLSLIFLVTLFSNLQAQSDDYYQLMDKGKQFMANNNFNQANVVFRQVLTLNVEIPAEFCYYFAETLFQIGQYKNSQDFINKYYELTERSGKYINEVKALEALLKAQTSSARTCNLCDEHGYIKGTCSTCKGEGHLSENCGICFGKGKVSCTLCAGNGVIIFVNVFGAREYNTCHRCDGKGYEACPRCDGDGTEEHSCPTCNGTGFVKKRTVCDHDQPNP